jgi:hypothetical protein
MAFGWKGFGTDLDRNRIETLLIPLGVPSIIDMAASSHAGVFAGPTFPATLHKYLYKVLRCPRPQFAAAAVIKIGKRLVNVIYGHRTDGAELSPEQIEGMDQVSTAAGVAYLRLIAASKGGSARDKHTSSRKVMIINKEDDASESEGEADESGETASTKKTTKRIKAPKADE